MQPPSVFLPPLAQHASPNQSGRRGIVPHLIVVHRPVAGFASALRTLTDDSRPPSQRVSAHVLTDSNRSAVQLVPWDRKAWSCGGYNSASYNVEVDDDAWNGRDEPALLTAARIVAFLCKRTGIPPSWTHRPDDVPGVCRHFDLGRLGGGHSDPTLDDSLWVRFVGRVRAEHAHGQFKRTWGVGALTPSV